MTRWLVIPATLAIVAGIGCDSPSSPSPPPPGGDAVLVGAGDIGWCDQTVQAATGALLDEIPGTVFTAGDNACPTGSADEFRNCYDPFWGRHRARTRPSPGNHDYGTPGAASYFAYFGANASPAGASSYAYTLGSWRVIVLDSNIDISATSVQAAWLRFELQENPTACTIAYWHHPLTSSTRGMNPAIKDVWRILQDAGAEVVITGHEHNYERLAPMDSEGRADVVHGIREFVVGTGGAALVQFGATAPTSEVRAMANGVIKFVLRPGSYEWEFIPVAGQTFHDSGVGGCH